MGGGMMMQGGVAMMPTAIGGHPGMQGAAAAGMGYRYAPGMRLQQHPTGNAGSPSASGGEGGGFNPGGPAINGTPGAPPNSYGSPAGMPQRGKPMSMMPPSPALNGLQGKDGQGQQPPQGKDGVKQGGPSTAASPRNPPGPSQSVPPPSSGTPGPMGVSSPLPGGQSQSQPPPSVTPSQQQPGGAQNAPPPPPQQQQGAGGLADMTFPAFLSMDSLGGDDYDFRTGGEDINFDRDFGQWFNPDDAMGMGFGELK